MGVNGEIKMKDIFSGKWWNIWEDEDMIFISIGNVTITFHISDWEDIKQEFLGMNEE